MNRDKIHQTAFIDNVKNIESHCWYINVEPYSGFNAFYGQSKMARENDNRENRIKHFYNQYTNELSNDEMDFILDKLQTLLLTKWRTKKDKDVMVIIRKELMTFINSIGNENIINSITKMVYRPESELEIRIPNAQQFHLNYPHFFVDNIFDPTTNEYVKNKEQRTFNLKLLPSGDDIKAYIGQENNKAIESRSSQGILGKWILRDIFQLNNYEPLTESKLNEIGINGIRLTKTNDYIEFQFIWIDSENEPDDIWK